jgi:glycosyltransferase involved in cell wall biosynthesis
MGRTASPVPTILLLVGDSTKGIEDLEQPWWRKTLIRLFWLWNQRQQLRRVHQSLTFVNSRKLYEELRPFSGHLHETHTTTLTYRDFFDRQDTCGAPPFHLLYTGRMDRGKGLLEMAQAVAFLHSKGISVALDLVGPRENGDPVIEEVQGLAREKGLTDKIRFHGYKSLGPELFDFYKKADLYLIASKSNEGFPRTIWEAMAHSLPVVATRVGSIPNFIEGAAKLVPPNDVPALAHGIQELLRDGTQRRDLICKGRALASELTLEKQVKVMASTIAQWLKLQEKITQPEELSLGLRSQISQNS